MAPSPPPRAPVAPVIQFAASDGCQPYWRELDLACRPDAIRAEFGGPPGSFRVCDPVHERITRSALSVILGRPATPDDPEVAEYLRGVVWNDDPEGLLSSPDLRWCQQLRSAKGHAPGVDGNLLIRSHLGDLQILHALATRPGETVQQTYKKGIVWLEFAWRVGVGDIPPDTLLAKVPVEHFPALFPRQAKWNVARLFLAGPQNDVKARALGSFLHVLQDLGGAGHAPANPVLGHTPVIQHYFTEAGGPIAGHAGDPGWREAWKPDAPLDAFPEADREVRRAVDLLRLAQRNAPWEMVHKYLDRFFFEYASLNAPATRWRLEKSKSPL